MSRRIQSRHPYECKFDLRHSLSRLQSQTVLRPSGDCLSVGSFDRNFDLISYAILGRPLSKFLAWFNVLARLASQWSLGLAAIPTPPMAWEARTEPWSSTSRR